jgi:anti-sigma B factor antagonist
LSDVVVIVPEGELDVARIGDFRVELSEAAAREPAQSVVVDLSSVSFIDSSGLGALLEFEHHLRRHKRELTVVAPEGTAVAVMLTLTGLRGRLPVVATSEAALEDLGS